jgi:hypothetical protein
MTPEATSRHVTQFGFTMLENGFALDARQHVVRSQTATRKSLIWARSVDSTLITGNPARLEDYISLLGNQDYSYLMNDGGVIQISYIFDRDQIERHRLTYFPCPFLISRRDLTPHGEEGILDFINDQLMTEVEENLLLKSPIRFDYAPGAAADYHPASHVTLNDPSCRIPARAPLNFDTFMKFVLENFYFDAWQSQAVIHELAFIHEEDCMSDHDRSRAYLDWVHR